MNDSFRASPRPSMVRALADYNPFYLLSAACMLAGLFALNGSLSWSPLTFPTLLLLITVLNLYEILLILIGIFLARRGLMRDAATLLIVEAFFLADVGFLNSEAFTQDYYGGLVVNLFLLVGAVVKVVLVFWGLGIRLTDPRFCLILSQVLILLALPGYLRRVADNDSLARVSLLAMYAAWWAVGIIPLLYLAFLRHDPWARHRGIILAFVVLPTLSIVTHLCTSNWVYNVRWQNANVGPLIVTLAAAIGASDWHVRNMAMRMRVHLLLPVLAIGMALPTDYRMTFWVGDFALSPLRLMLLTSAAVYVYGVFVHRHALFVLAAMACLGISGVGHTPEAMARHTVASGNWVLSTLKRLIPQTLSQWGIISVISSFVLLGLGLLLSLLRPVPREAIPVLPMEESTLN